MSAILIIAAIIVVVVAFIIFVAAGNNYEEHSVKYEKFRAMTRRLQSQQLKDEEWKIWLRLGEDIIAFCDAEISQSQRDARAAGQGHKSPSEITPYFDWRRRVELDLSNYGSARAHSKMPTQQSPSLERLIELRAEDMISQDEFSAFSECFKKTPGEKAQAIIAAIEMLSEQHKSGAMSDGNYHSGLWSLLDKLDRQTK